MTDLLLQPTANRALYEVIANKQVVGRIAMFGSLRNKPWGMDRLSGGPGAGVRLRGVARRRHEGVHPLLASVQLCSMTRARLRSVILSMGQRFTAAR